MYPRLPMDLRKYVLVSNQPVSLRMSSQVQINHRLKKLFISRLLIDVVLMMAYNDVVLPPIFYCFVAINSPLVLVGSSYTHHV